MAPTMPNAHSGIRNQGLSNAPYQLPRDSPIRAVPKSANNTHTATATNNGPILNERTNDLPRSFGFAAIASLHPLQGLGPTLRMFVCSASSGSQTRRKGLQ